MDVTAPPGIAARALLDAGDLPAGFGATEIDPAERWAEIVTTASSLQSLRPGCDEELDAITSTLGTVPPDAAGAAFHDEDGREVAQFTGVTTPEAGAALIARIAELNSRCDAYELQIPERGSLAMTVRSLDLGATGVVTAWQTTLLSEHLRTTQQYVAMSAEGVVTFLATSGRDITGEAPLNESELADVVRHVQERTRTAVTR